MTAISKRRRGNSRRGRALIADAAPRRLSALLPLGICSVLTPGLATQTAGAQEPPPAQAQLQPTDRGVPAADTSHRLRPHQVALGLSLEPTWLSELSYQRTDPGLFAPGGHTRGVVGFAPLTRRLAYRLGLERAEHFFPQGTWLLSATSGLRVSGAEDSSGRYTALAGALGMQGGVRFASSSLALRLVYRPALVTWVSFTGEYRESFRERYPDERNASDSNSGIPDGATLALASQRLEAAVVYDVSWSDWSLGLAAGAFVAPASGPYWASLELGQVPILLATTVAYRL